VSVNLPWFTAAELAAMDLPGMPDTERSFQRIARREEWDHPDAEGRLWRRRSGRGGGVEYALAVLPSYVQAKILARTAATAAPAVKDVVLQRLSDDAAWDAYERQPEKHKARARARVEALDAVAALVTQGRPRTVAIMEVAASRQISRAQLYEWAKLVDSVPRAGWLARLVPQYSGATGARATCNEDAWEWLRSHYLASNRLTFDKCWRDLEKVAAQNGWALPSARTMRRRIDALPDVVKTWKRHGPEATDALFPTQRRDRSMLHAMEWLNADGHRFDVFVRWEDGEKARPMVVFFQDLFSGKLLGYRVGRDETGDVFRLAFGDVVEKYGIPGKVTIDNTLAAANKTMSGGLKRRFRFKVRAEEPLGIFPTLGVEVHWAKPYSGRSKPIERAFGDLARDIARHPAFIGAWTGNAPTNKPHDYDSKAVPIATFLQVLEAGIAEHNARPGRTAANCRGRSFDETFAESYAQVPITRATDAQRRVFLLAAEEVRVRRDASIHLLGNRYHDACLVELRGRPVTVRFDPEHLHAPVHVYRADGAFVATAECIADVGFGDVDAARRTAQAVKLRRKGFRLLADAEDRISAEQRTRDLAATRPDTPAVPERNVIRPLFRGATALKPIAIQEEEEDAAAAQIQRAIHHAFGARRALSVVPDPDDEEEAGWG